MADRHPDHTTPVGTEVLVLHEGPGVIVAHDTPGDDFGTGAQVDLDSGDRVGAAYAQMILPDDLTDQPIQGDDLPVPDEYARGDIPMHGDRW